MQKSKKKIQQLHTRPYVYVSEHQPKELYEQKKRQLLFYKNAKKEQRQATWSVRNGEYCLFIDGKK